MDAIFSLARKLALLAVFAGFCELLLPSGKFRSFIRFGVGLVVIALMLQPLAQLRGLKFDPEELLGREGAPPASVEGEDWVRAQTQDLVEKELARQVGEYLAQEYPQYEARVTLDVSFTAQGQLEEFRGMRVALYPAGEEIEPIAPVVIGRETQEGPPLPPGLATELARHLGVSPDKITLTVQGEGGGRHE